MAETSTPASASPPYPTRFGWAMRILLCVLLFDMVFRSLSVLYPWHEWLRDLEMRRMPLRLPTRAEIHKLRAETNPDKPTPLTDDVMLSADSLWDYFRPWPGPLSRAKMQGWSDRGKWVLCWTCSRLEFFENLVGFNNEWPMFSPSVGTIKYLARARLVYADGSERIVRNKGEPADLTRYAHWWEEKILDHELKVRDGESRADEAFGYCNLLSHRHASNDAGSPLVRIHLFLVRYDLPPPGEDAHAWYSRLNEEPTRVFSDFYVFDVKRRHGKCIE